MWADHVEALGTCLTGMGFDDNFCAQVTNHVKKMLDICVEDPSGTVCSDRSWGFRCPRRGSRPQNSKLSRLSGLENPVRFCKKICRNFLKNVFTINSNKMIKISSSVFSIYLRSLCNC